MISLLGLVVTSRWTWIGLTVLGLAGGLGAQTQRLHTTRLDMEALHFQYTTALEANQTQSRLLSEQNEAIAKLKRDYAEAQARLAQAELQANDVLDRARQKAAEMTRQPIPRECDKAIKWALQQEIQARQARTK